MANTAAIRPTAAGRRARLHWVVGVVARTSSERIRVHVRNQSQAGSWVYVANLAGSSTLDQL